jgi:hypothetical protein
MKERRKMQTYKFKNSYGLLGKKAKIYGIELERIKRQNNGFLTPQEVVNEARKTNSPLHNCFDWNDSTAAEQWRLQQARQLITSINLVIEYKGKQEEIDAYVNVFLPNKKGKCFQAYIDIQSAMGNTDFKNQVIMDAMNELLYWQKKYQRFKEFSEIFKVIKKIQKKFK